MTPVVNFVLASGSPRRKNLLNGLGLEPVIIVPEIDEIFHGGDPISWAQRVAEEKVDAVLPKLGTGEHLVLGADTIVIAGGKVLGKPGNRRQAREMLSTLNGRTHQVVTAVHLRVIPSGKGKTFHEVTDVSFRNLAPDEIEKYLNTGEPMDKAGAYGAQGYGALLIAGVKGCFFNVVGLPLSRLAVEAAGLGFPLWTL